MVCCYTDDCNLSVASAKNSTSLQKQPPAAEAPLEAHARPKADAALPAAAADAGVLADAKSRADLLPANAQQKDDGLDGGG